MPGKIKIYLALIVGVMIIAVIFLVNSSASRGVDLAQGKTLYLEYCASCHGTNLEGQPDWRQRKADGKLPAPPHDASGHTWHHADDLLLKITKLGTEAVVGRGYQSDMPGFADTLSDTEIMSILAYIKSTWPEAIRKRHDRINNRKK